MPENSSVGHIIPRVILGNSGEFAMDVGFDIGAVHGLIITFLAVWGC